MKAMDSYDSARRRKATYCYKENKPNNVRFSSEEKTHENIFPFGVYINESISRELTTGMLGRS